MSTNYYLYDLNSELGHIGKSGNSCFIAKAPAGVDSFNAWAATLQGHRIFDEFGLELSAEEMVQIALERSHTYYRQPRSNEGEFVDRGVLFVRHEFC